MAALSIKVTVMTVALMLGLTGTAPAADWVMASHLRRTDGLNSTKVLERFTDRSECMATLRWMARRFLLDGETVSWLDEGLVVHNMGPQKNLTAFLTCLDTSD